MCSPQIWHRTRGQYALILFLLLYMLYFPQCCGSGIPCFFTPRIRDRAMVGSGSGIRDKQTKFVNNLYTKIGRILDPVLFYPPDPGWSNGRIRIRDKTSRIRNTDLPPKNMSQYHLADFHPPWTLWYLQVRVCDSCFDKYGPKETTAAAAAATAASSLLSGKEPDLPAEYLASPLSKQSQVNFFSCLSCWSEQHRS
jgi:hypothetical protein